MKLPNIRLPTRQEILESKMLSRIAHRFDDDVYWHLSKPSVLRGVAVGMFFTWFPIIGGQMLLCAIFSWLLRGHIPLSVACSWVSNPISFAPMMYLNYLAGVAAYELFTATQLETIELSEFQLSTLMQALGTTYFITLVGSTLVGLATAAISCGVIAILWKPNPATDAP